MANNPGRELPPITELGLSGLKRFSGYVFEEPLREMQGDRWRKTIAEMELDPIAGAVLFAIDMMIRRVTWKIQPASESAEDKNIAEFVDQCRDDMNQPWSETVSEILTMLPYGWAWFELVYKERQGEQDSTDPQAPASSKYDDGRIGWRKWGIRGQDSLFRWEFDDKGGIRGMHQLAPPTYQLTYIPVEKSLLFRTASRKGNPEGRSVFRSAYRSWYIKRNIENIEGIGIERDMAGLPVAYVPPELLNGDASADEQNLLTTIKNIVRNIRRDEQEGIVWPLAYDENGQLLYDLKLLSTGGGRQFDTDRVIARYDQRIAMSVLADFILMGHENVGSFALGQSKSDLFVAALDSWLKAIADVVNRYAIPRLLKLNGMKPKEMPKLTHGEITKITLEELSAYITTLANVGMPLFPDADLEQYLRDQGSLPKAAGTAISQMEQQMALIQAKAEQPDKGWEEPKRAGEYSADEEGALVQAAVRLLTRGT
ncbi:MAG: hypothetical protein E6Q97_16060 [Desulfurellales bacterium]|nr:MAG: hypothetical protein E6Q97_16060 [Desulfurellales bacterium]